MSLSNILMYLVPLIVTPILSRLFLPVAFGEWGVFSSVISIIGIGIFLGYENAIVKARSEVDAANICALCILIATIILSVLFVFFLLSKYFNVLFIINFSSSGLLFVYLIFHVFYMILYNIANRNECYNTLAVSHVVSGLSQATFRLFFGIISFSMFNGLILGTTLALIINVLYISISIRHQYKSFFLRTIHFKKILLLAKQYKRFPIYDAPGSIMAFAAFQSPTIILALFFSKSEIGCFSVVIQLLLMPMSFIGAAMSKVYYQQLSRVQNNIEEISKVTNNVVKTVCLISIIPLLFLAFGGDKVIVLFLGQKWLTTGKIALSLALWSFPTVLTEPLIPLYRTLDKQRTLLYFNALYFIFGIGTIIIGCIVTNNLYLILLAFSLICFVIKFSMFFNIINLARLTIRNISNWIFLIWFTGMFVLTIRLLHLLF